MAGGAESLCRRPGGLQEVRGLASAKRLAMRMMLTRGLLLVALGCPAQEMTTVRYAGRRFTVCTVDLTKQRLELFWRDGRRVPFRGFGTLDTWLRRKGRQVEFAMNAGMFQDDGSPVGLYVERGHELRPLNLRRGHSNFTMKPNGVFMVTRAGAAVVESSRYRGADSAVLATQSGPMLVISGHLHPSFRRGSESRLIRNGVGVASARKVLFAISEDPVNFHEFATFFRDGLGCPNALYLDGNVSSLYSTALGRDDNAMALGPIIAVTGPAQARRKAVVQNAAAEPEAPVATKDPPRLPVGLMWGLVALVAGVLVLRARRGMRPRRREGRSRR